MALDRRKFIQLSTLAGASLLVPKFLKAFVPGVERPNAAHSRILVVLHLNGGNDGLNTIIPVRNDVYYRSRPTLGIPRKAALTLNDDTGLHPALKNIKALYDEGGVAIVNGAGYPNPLRSHHGSTAIWQMAGKSFGPMSSYPDLPLSDSLRKIAAQITSGAPSPVYHVSHGSFDTHVNQLERQHDLFSQMDGALAAFVVSLKAAGKFNDVAIMIFSEFGRRVAENEYGGTDHGTAGPMLFLSGSLRRPGLYNPVLSLTDLDDGDLKHTVDFPHAYADVLESWLSMDSGRILEKKYVALGLF